MIERTCCFIGHRQINETEDLKRRLRDKIEDLIVHKNVNTFLFGSKSRFNDLCYELVTTIKEKYPQILRIYVRAEFPFINEEYKNFLLKEYEDTYYPQKIIGAGKAAYIERNYEMIDRSRFCIVYYDETYAPTTRKSGTKRAVEYSIKCKKEIFMFP